MKWLPGFYDGQHGEFAGITEGWSRLLEVCAHQIDEVFGEFRSDLFFCAVDEMKANVVFKHLCHQAVDPTADCGKEHELVTTIRVGIDGTLHCVELAAQLAEALEQLHLFPWLEGHRTVLLDNTHPGYGT